MSFQQLSCLSPRAWECSTRLRCQICNGSGLGCFCRARLGASTLGLLRTPRASLRASLRAPPGRHLGVVRPKRPNSKGRQQGVAKRKTSGGSTRFSRWRLCTLVGDRHPVLKQKMTYECTVWVPLESYGEYRGCYLGRRRGVLAALWGVSKVSYPSRAPGAPQIGASCATLLDTSLRASGENRGDHEPVCRKLMAP